jgi:cellulose synthase/poly-beta-1,6-N-acetylglucosamine synthase-like glycosyltransferase
MAGHRRPDELVVVVRDVDHDTARALDAWLAEGKLRPGTDLCRAIVTRPGQIAAMNCGLEVATSDVVCFIDDDCVARPDWLERLAGYYEDPTVGGVGGRDLVHEGGTILRGRVDCVGKITWYGRMVGNHHLNYSGPVTEVDHLKGANMSFRRALLRPFDERLSGGSSCLNDTDMSLHVKAQGFRLLYDPELVVDHYPAQRFDTSTRVKTDPNLVYSDSHNWVYCMCKHLGPLRRAVFVAYALLVGGGTRYGLLKWWWSLPRNPRGATRQFVASTRGKLAGLRTWYQARRALARGES